MSAKVLTAVLLVLAVAGSSGFNLAWANPKLPDAMITFHSPQEGGVYSSSLVLLNFSVWAINDYNNGTRQAWYSIDGRANTPLPLSCQFTGSVIGYPCSRFWGTTHIPLLSAGNHDVVVTIEYTFGDFMLTRSSSVTFSRESSVAMAKPSVPEFTVEFVDSSFTTPMTYSIDPNTRQNVTHLGSYVANKTIEIAIANQDFMPYYDESIGWNISFYYNIRVKMSNEETWRQLYTNDSLPAMSISNYTTFFYSSLQPNQENTYVMGTYHVDLLPGSQVDFQVEAMIGYIHRVPSPVALYPYVFTGEESNWSNTQTLSIPTNFELLSPTNTTYARSDVSLTFKLSLPFQESQYSLDGNNNVTLNGNTTLTGLPNGLHSITLYANNLIDNTWKSNTVTFKIEKREPFTLVSVASFSTIIAVAIAAAALIYLKKRKSPSAQGMVKNP